MNLQQQARSAGLDKPTFRLLVTAFALSLLHIADHVLRGDHSGWPFRHQITPFTFSLLAFPMLLFALFGPRRLYWWRWALPMAATVAKLYAHIAIETPYMQFAMWAKDQSADAQLQGFHNLLDVRSPSLGILSMTIAMVLNLTAIISSVAMYLQGRRLHKESSTHLRNLM